MPSRAVACYDRRHERRLFYTVKQGVLSDVKPLCLFEIMPPSRALCYIRCDLCPTPYKIVPPSLNLTGTLRTLHTLTQVALCLI
jgi:hypothetical protein